MASPAFVPASVEEGLAPEQAAAAAGLVHVSDQQPGYRRRRRGRGFSYLRPDGRLVRDPRERRRIALLAIPPAWTGVWICRDPRGHLQATGRDARGRKQYRYHEAWRRVRDDTKFDRMLAFGRHLPRIRARVARDLRRTGLPREKVLATVVRLLDRAAPRIGNAAYREQNGSHGLTTLRSRHVRRRSGTLELCYRGKGGQRRVVAVNEARLVRVIRQCHELPGQELFQYLDDEDRPRPIDSGDVNAYLKEIARAPFTAKDFRTWSGTRLALRELRLRDAAKSERKRRNLAADAVRGVAERLGNTPTVCRTYYVHPTLLEAYVAGRLGDALRDAARVRARRGLSRNETVLLGLLEAWSRG